MENYSLFLIKNNGQKYNITKLSANLSWSDDIDTLGTQLSFDFARNSDDIYMKNFDIAEAGDKLILQNNDTEIFRGIITNINWNKYSKGVIAYDYAFYLNQSKTIKQFKNIAGDEAIKELCRIFNVQVGKISAITTNISKIYKDKTIAEIIKDILYQAENELDKSYRLEMRENKLYIEEYKDLIIEPQFKPALNIKSFNPLNAINDVQKSESIQELRNKLLIISNESDYNRIIEEVKDQKSIEKFGLLQETITVQFKDESQANNIAKNKLKELNRVQEEISLELLGDDILRAGRIINVNDDYFKINGKYLIKSTRHTYNNSIHKVNLTLKKVVD